MSLIVSILVTVGWFLHSAGSIPLVEFEFWEFASPQHWSSPSWCAPFQSWMGIQVNDTVLEVAPPDLTRLVSQMNSLHHLFQYRAYGAKIEDENNLRRTIEWVLFTQLFHAPDIRRPRCASRFFQGIISLFEFEYPPIRNLSQRISEAADRSPCIGIPAGLPFRPGVQVTVPMWNYWFQSHRLVYISLYQNITERMRTDLRKALEQIG